MTDPVEIAVIGAITTTIVGLWNGIVLLKLHSQSKANGRSINTVLEQTNGIQDKLLASEKELSHQQGMEAQREKDKLSQ